MIKKIVITVPVYKPAISPTEELSLRQLLKILKDYSICFITYKELDFFEYEKFLADIDYKIIYFDRSFFSSISGYNKLLLSKKFYKKFTEYSFLLIYQLDAWVFRNELLYWAEQGYDYIGAPWFSSDKPESGLPHFLGVGNGGFSLRNVKNHLRVLNKFSFIISPFTVIKQFRDQPSLSSFWCMLGNLTVNNNTHYLLGKYTMNEDTFWGLILKRKYSWFKAPDMINAANFSIETNAEKLYNILNQKLPFGCHGWDKYDTNFWAEHILIK